MVALLILCFLIYMSAYFSLSHSKQTIEVRGIQSFEDYFIDSNEKINAKPNNQK